MIFVTGGLYAGKKEFIHATFGFTEEACSPYAHTNAPLFYYDSDLTPPPSPDLLSLLWEKEVVVIPEMGCGLVPLDPKQRNLREEWGRIACQVAKRSEEVYRVTMGIGVRLK